MVEAWKCRKSEILKNQKMWKAELWKHKQFLLKQIYSEQIRNIFEQFRIFVGPKQSTPPSFFSTKNEFYDAGIFINL